METNETKTKPKREVYDRPEERDLRVLAVVAGIDRLSKANLLTPYELSIALKLALGAMVKGTRAPMATIHQFRGFLLDLESEVGGQMSEVGGLDALTSDLGRLTSQPDGKEGSQG